MVLSVDEYAKYFDLALLGQDTTQDGIEKYAQRARDANLAAFYTTTCWTPTVARVLQGSDVHVGAAISFPYGTTSTAIKFAEIDESLEQGATAVDMVVNIGALRGGDFAYVEREIKGLVERCGDQALSKLIYEVGFLTDQEITDLTKICVDAGVDYIKTATGSEALPNEFQVKLMRDNIGEARTKLKVSGVPRTFTLAATLWMIETLGVSLIGTRSAVQLVDQYASYLENGV